MRILESDRVGSKQNEWNRTEPDPIESNRCGPIRIEMNTFKPTRVDVSRRQWSRVISIRLNSSKSTWFFRQSDSIRFNGVIARSPSHRCWDGFLGYVLWFCSYRASGPAEQTSLVSLGPHGPGPKWTPPPGIPRIIPRKPGNSPLLISFQPYQ